MRECQRERESESQRERESERESERVRESQRERGRESHLEMFKLDRPRFRCLEQALTRNRNFQRVWERIHLRCTRG